MKKQLITVAVAAAIVAGAVPGVHAKDADAAENSHRQHIGTGIGAVAGGLLAGPVGVLAGGLIGNLAGRYDADAAEQQAPSIAANTTQPDAPVQAEPAPATTSEADEAIVLSQAGDAVPVIDDTAAGDANALTHILISDMGLDVLFLSGSTSVETLYLPRLQTIASVMALLPDVELHLDGYSDRRGDSDTNLALSTRRLESVRRQLVEAGVDESRIQVNAFGEKNFVSVPGDLEAYTFDRRVVVRFEQAAPESARPIALTETGAVF
jgi:outer membrane protein OmpA-like peptidoglycan-associated protein